MQDNLFRQFGTLVKREKAKFKVRFAAFSFFLLVAGILWYLNKLSYEYTVDVNFPVRFENTPSGKILVGEPPKHVSLNVRGFGYTLLKYKVNAKLSPITINLQSSGILKEQDDDQKFMLITNRSRHLFSGYLSSDLILERVSPDTIFLQFTNLAERKVAVKPQVDYTLKKQFMASGDVSVVPDSVVLTGPQAIIDTIFHVQTDKHIFTDLDRTITTKLRLTTIPQVSFSHRMAEVKIPVERYTEANFALPIEIRNLPDSLRLIILPRFVQVKCNVRLSEYHNLEHFGVTAYVDFNETGQMIGNRLIIKVEREDHVVSNLGFEPNYVEYFIEKL